MYFINNQISKILLMIVLLWKYKMSINNYMPAPAFFFYQDKRIFLIRIIKW